MLKSTSRYCFAIAFVALLAPAISLAAPAFSFDNVAQVAKKLAAKPYQAPPGIPGFLANLSYDEFSQVRFNPKDTLWQGNCSPESQATDGRSGASNHGAQHVRDAARRCSDQGRSQGFGVMLVAPGEYFKHPVTIDIVESTGVHALKFQKDWFTWPKDIVGKIPDNLGYAGFKLTFPLDGSGDLNQFLVFAGASYFRGVARDQHFGLSARGIAVDTGLKTGEEFPDFTRFWLVRPGKDAKTMRFYALLDGPSLTGAYQLDVTPGAPTRLAVHVRLFPRKSIPLLGLAPLTSMFYYGSNTPRWPGEWRGAVHDSGGLLVHSGTGEWLWRPLINPKTLQMDYFAANTPKGFGLLQRDTRFADYEDAGARYDDRPSAWVAPDGNWGDGNVVLVELPASSENDDNIVAFWSPKQAPPANKAYDVSYTLSLGALVIPNEPSAQAVATYIGNGTIPGTDKPAGGYRVIVDFAGGPLAKLKPDAKVQAVVTGLDGTKVKQQAVSFVQPSKRWRLSMLVVPAGGKPLALRAFLKQGNATISETWTYSLPAQNRFNAGP